MVKALPNMDDDLSCSFSPNTLITPEYFFERERERERERFLHIQVIPMSLDTIHIAWKGSARAISALWQTLFLLMILIKTIHNRATYMYRIGNECTAHNIALCHAKTILQIPSTHKD